MPNSLMGTLLEAINTATGKQNSFDGGLQALCDMFAIPPGNNNGRLVSLARMFDSSISTASGALNYFLLNPTVLPQFGIGFANSGPLDSRVSFASTAGGTYYDSAGTLKTAATNEPRFNYDQSTRQPDGLMIFAAQTENASISPLSSIGGFPSSGTVYAEVCVPTLGGAGFPGVISFDDGTANNAITINIYDATTDQIYFEAFSGGVAQCQIRPAQAATSGLKVKCAASWSNNSFRFSWNGNLATEDTSGSIPTVTRLLLGQLRGGGGYLNCEIRSVALFNYQMTNTQLATFTG